MIKDNARRFAKEMYGTDNPTQDQITAATSVLANTAQNLVDNNSGYDVPYSKQAESFLHTLQSEYAASSPNLSIGNGQYLFYATPEQKSSPYINMGTQDKEIAGLIIKAPIAQPDNGLPANTNRDKLTGLLLDDQGRYSQKIVVEDKAYTPKYFACATTECVTRGGNLDMSDPGTAAYVKALDKKILSDIGTGATVVAIANPLGVLGTVAGTIGAISSISSGLVDDTTGQATSKEALQFAAQKYIETVFKLPPAAAVRVTELVNLAGGWDAFVSRANEEIGEKKK